MVTSGKPHHAQPVFVRILIPRSRDQHLRLDLRSVLRYDCDVFRNDPPPLKRRNVRSASKVLAGLVAVGALVAAVLSCGGGNSSNSSGSGPPPSPDFAISVSPSSATVPPGGTFLGQVSVTAKNGFTGSVTVSVSGLPAGATILPSSPFTMAPGSQNITINLPSNAAQGNFTVSLQASSGTLQHSSSNSIPAPSPTGMDMSLDGKHLIVTSNVQQIVLIDTTSLQVVQRTSVRPIVQGGASYAIPDLLANTSNGTALVGMTNNSSPPSYYLERWNPATGSFTALSAPGIGVWINQLVRTETGRKY
jgi:hypothetical protein